MEFTFKYVSLILIFMLSVSPFRAEAETTFNYNFSKGLDGWVGDFADYPVGEEAFYELSWGWTNLPYPLPENEKGIVISGNNHSDDLLMFIKRQITGLEPNTEYKLDFDVTIQTNTPVGQFGVGGSPGDSVFFKVGASPEEPMKNVLKDYYRLNIDVGIQSNSGANGVVIGNLANPAVNPDNPTFAPKKMSNIETFTARTDDNGSIWLFIGTDSAFEATSLYYIANITLTVE